MIPGTKAKDHYSREELLACGRGEMFGPGITRITDTGGAHDKGQVIAELDIQPDLWFFGCHFINDPVMPGCLGLDAMWQLVGYFLGWSGAPGKGRALGVGEVRFTGQVTPKVKKVVYRIDLKRVIMRRLVLGIGDGVMEADGKVIYEAKDLRVGLYDPKDLV